MKNILKKAVIGLFAVVTAVSCQKNLTEINEDPNRPTAVPTPFLLTRAQYRFMYNLYGAFTSVRINGVASQHWAQSELDNESLYGFRISSDNTVFENVYLTLNDAQSIIDICTTDPTMAQYGDVDLQVASAMIMKAYGLQLLAETFGGIPYTESYHYNSVEGQGVVTPKYNTQKEVFEALEKDLTKASDLLKGVIDRGGKGWTSPSTGTGSCDVMLGGKPENWYRFANTMLLRLAVRTSNVDPNWKTKAQAAIARGIIETNAGNASLNFISANPGYSPIYYMYFVNKRNDFTMSYALAEYMKGGANPKPNYTSPMAGQVDPRLAAMVGDHNANLLGLPYGLPSNIRNAYWEEYRTKTISMATNNCKVSEMEFWMTMTDCANSLLLKAEVTGDVNDFEAGVKASLEEWGAADNGYVAFVTNLFNAADDEGKKELCVTQKYIHNFGHNSMEAWSEYRRTGYPKMLVLPGEVTANVTYANGTTESYKFQPIDESITEIVARMKYPSGEYTKNGANLRAVGLPDLGAGGDAYTTKLWWAKK